MADAQWDSTVILIAGVDHGGELIFRANGRTLIFDGFYKIVGIPTISEEIMLPLVTEKQTLAAIQVDPTQHFTSPPPRYTEASLVKKLESVIDNLAAKGISKNLIRERCLVTPSCGTGSLSVALAEKVMEDLAGVSRLLKGGS